MNLTTKSIAHAFRSENVEIYKPLDGIKNYFFASHLVCRECEKFWHTDLIECWLCGEYNYSIQECNQPNHQPSFLFGLAKSKTTCYDGHDTEKLSKNCINENCPSHKNDDIKTIISKKTSNKGIFENKKSSFKTSMLHCVNCGGRTCIYKDFLVFVETWSLTDQKKNENIRKSHDVDNHIVIFKKYQQVIKNPSGLPPSIEYAFFIGKDDPKAWKPHFKKDIFEVIDMLFTKP